MLRRVQDPNAEQAAELLPALSYSPSGMGYNRPGACSQRSKRTPHITSEPQITWPLPKAQILTCGDTATNADETEPFPDLPNPANNLILARTTLLRQLDAVKEKTAYARIRPKLSYDSIYSRVTSHTGHIKENENLNRSKADLTSSLASIEQVRQKRSLGNKRKVFALRHLDGAKSEQPRDELRRALKQRVDDGIKAALSYEREHGWDVVVEPPYPYGEFRDFHDPHWQLQMMSPLQPGTALTRNVIISLLMLKQTFPLRYLAIDVNPAAVAIGLNGHPRSKSPIINVNDFESKRFKPSRILGLPCDSSEKYSRRRRSSSKDPRSPKMVLNPEPNGKTLKAKTSTFMHHIATKLTVRRPSKTNRVCKKSASASLAVAVAANKSESDSDYTDSDDEYAARVELLEQEAQSEEKVSQWLKLTFDGKPIDEFDDVGSAEFGPLEFEAPDIALVSPRMPVPVPMSLPMCSVEETVLTSVPSSPSPSTTPPPPAGKVDLKTGKGPEMATMFSPVSTLSPFDRPGDSSSESDSDHDVGLTADVAAIQTVKLQKPTAPIRMVSIRKRAKGSPSAGPSRRVFHGALIGTSPLPVTATATVRAPISPRSSSLNRTVVNTNANSSFSQRQREFLHRQHRKSQGAKPRP